VFAVIKIAGCLQATSATNAFSSAVDLGWDDPLHGRLTFATPTLADGRRTGFNRTIGQPNSGWVRQPPTVRPHMHELTSIAPLRRR
jgi:hypothetical protein